MAIVSWAKKELARLKLQNPKRISLRQASSLAPVNISAATSESCRLWLTMQWEVTIDHVYREQNRVADALASFALTHERGLWVWSVPGVAFAGPLDDDSMQVAFPRRVRSG